MKKVNFKWRENHLPPTFFNTSNGIDSIPLCVFVRTPSPANTTTTATNDFPFLVLNEETTSDGIGWSVE